MCQLTVEICKHTWMRWIYACSQCLALTSCSEWGSLYLETTPMNFIL